MNELFPLGTIVTLKEHEGPIMIMGYYQNVNDRVYDYIGVPYPQGFISKNAALVFDHSALDLLVSKGYEDEEAKQFLVQLPEVMAVAGAYHEAQKGE